MSFIMMAASVNSVQAGVRRRKGSGYSKEESQEEESIGCFIPLIVIIVGIIWFMILEKSI